MQGKIYQHDIVNYTGMAKNKTTISRQYDTELIGPTLLSVECQPINQGQISA
jgi:hypothetical protein